MGTMQRLRVLGPVVMTVVGFFSFVPRSDAQNRTGSIEIGTCAGRFFGGSLAAGTNHYFNHRVEVDDDKMKGLWLGANLNQRWGIEVAVRRTATHLIERGSGAYSSQGELAGFDFAAIEASVTRSFTRGSFSPYVAAGAGMANLDINLPDRSIRDTNRMCLVVAGGGRFLATTWLGVRFDVRARFVYLGMRYGSRDRGWNDRGRWLSTQEVSIGLFGRFGGL